MLLEKRLNLIKINQEATILRFFFCMYTKTNSFKLLVPTIIARNLKQQELNILLR